jgi:hypothetical protein
MSLGREADSGSVNAGRDDVDSKVKPLVCGRSSDTEAVAAFEVMPASGFTPAEAGSRLELVGGEGAADTAAAAAPGPAWCGKDDTRWKEEDSCHTNS